MTAYNICYRIKKITNLPYSVYIHIIDAYWHNTICTFILDKRLILTNHSESIGCFDKSYTAIMGCGKRHAGEVNPPVYTLFARVCACTLVWTKQFSFGHRVACYHWKLCTISLKKTVPLWSLCGVLSLKKVYWMLLGDDQIFERGVYMVNCIWLCGSTGRAQAALCQGRWFDPWAVSALYYTRRPLSIHKLTSIFLRTRINR